MTIPVPIGGGGGGGSEVGIGDSLMIFGRSEPTFTDEEGRVWQITGLINEDVESYPDADIVYTSNVAYKLPFEFDYSARLNPNSFRGILAFGDKYLAVYGSSSTTRRIDFMDSAFNVVGSSPFDNTANIIAIGKYNGQIFTTGSTGDINVITLDLTNNTVVSTIFVGNTNTLIGFAINTSRASLNEETGILHVFDSADDTLYTIDVRDPLNPVFTGNYGDFSSNGFFNYLSIGNSLICFTASNQDNPINWSANGRQLFSSPQFSNLTTLSNPTYDIENLWLAINVANDDVVRFFELKRGVGNVSVQYKIQNDTSWNIPYYVRIK